MTDRRPPLFSHEPQPYRNPLRVRENEIVRGMLFDTDTETGCRINGGLESNGRFLGYDSKGAGTLFNIIHVVRVYAPN